MLPFRSNINFFVWKINNFSKTQLFICNNKQRLCEMCNAMMKRRKLKIFSCELRITACLWVYICKIFIWCKLCWIGLMQIGLVIIVKCYFVHCFYTVWTMLFCLNNVVANVVLLHCFFNMFEYIYLFHLSYITIAMIRMYPWIFCNIILQRMIDRHKALE